MSDSVQMPALGESVTEGTVTRWLKQVGDPVAVDEPLLEVSTDKVDTEIPSPVAGTLLEILVAEDETVAVGVPLARIGSSCGACSTCSSCSTCATSATGSAAASGSGSACSGSGWASACAPSSPPSPAPTSSAEPIRAKGTPTATVSSSATRISSSVPATGEGISVSTLSVD